MSKWIVIITEKGVLNSLVFDSEHSLLHNMKWVVQAAQMWDHSRFTQWVRNAKAGQWVEMRDVKNRIRALVVRSSDPKEWWYE